MEYPEQQPAQEDQKNRTLLVVLLSGCGCLVIIAAVFILFSAKLFGLFKAPGKTVDKHLEAINKGDYDLAYTFFTVAYRREHTLQQFRDDLRPFSTLLPYRESDLHRIKIENDRALIEGTLTGKDGAIVPLHYELNKEQGDWKITTYQWTSPGERQTI